MPVQSYLNQTVTKKAVASYDVYGKPVVSTPVSLRVRIQNATKRLVAQNNGVEFVIDAEMWAKPTENIALDDVITWDTVNYKVVRVDTKKGLVGNTDHKKVLLIRTKE